MNSVVTMPATSGVPVEVVVDRFNSCFADSHNTILCGGASEPFYQPASVDSPARIFFREDFVRSALHEVAHWCVAGSRRRQLPDYGYWYSPDDRDAEQQAAFFAVEARPQALEMLFCEALRLSFRPSIDNLSLTLSACDIEAFEARLHAAAQRFRDVGLPDRAAQFHTALSALSQRQVSGCEAIR